MLWQSIAQHRHRNGARCDAAVTDRPLIILIVLLGMLSVLAFSKIARWRETDRVLGGLTYPLYLYHEVVLVIVLTFTVGYSYGVFVGGILLSLLVAIALTALVDPVVNRYRDKVRGSALQHSGLPRSLRPGVVLR